MQYRKFGKLDWYVSALGFGAMRLPVRGDNTFIQVIFGGAENDLNEAPRSKLRGIKPE